MKDSLGFARFVCLLCLLLVCFSLSGMARAEAADKQFVSRVVEVAGVKLITRGAAMAHRSSCCMAMRRRLACGRQYYLCWANNLRSEERRVGEEWRERGARWW